MSEKYPELKTAANALKRAVAAPAAPPAPHQSDPAPDPSAAPTAREPHVITPAAAANSPEANVMEDARGVAALDRDGSRRGFDRSKRKLLGQAELKLSAPNRDGFHRRWFNDDGNRLIDAQEAGYTFVQDEAKSAREKRAIYLSRLVGTQQNGQPQYAFLMEKPLQQYREDQARKQRPLDEFDNAIGRGVIHGADEGDKSAGVFYDAGINVTSRN